MSHDPHSQCLAITDGGYVRRCLSGCVHLAFGRVTLHFDTTESFEGLAEVLLNEEIQRDPNEGLEVMYEWFSFSLSADDARSLADLVGEAVKSIAWIRGDLQFSDVDFERLIGDARH